MKKITAFLLAAVLMLALLPPSALAKGTLRVTSVSGRRGEQAVVEVQLESDDVCGGNFDVRFDESCLSLVAAEAVGGSWMPVLNDAKKAEGQVSFAFMASEPVTEGTLLRLTFRIQEDTAISGTEVRLENVRLRDGSGAETQAEVFFGSVSRACAWFTLSSADTVENQTVRAEVSIGGALHPAGAGFTLRYDSRVLQAVSVLALDGAANAQLAYSIDTPGEVRVSFAGMKGVSGALCAVLFRAVGAAGGSTALTLEEVRAYDETGAALDSAVSSGRVNIVLPSTRAPKLWVVGGAMDENGAAEAEIVLQGRGIVCGGNFTLSYDPQMTVRVSAGSSVYVNDEKPGTLSVSWGSAVPELNEKTLLSISIENAAEGSELTFGSNVMLYSESGAHIGVVDIRPAKLQRGSSVTAVVDEKNTSSEVTGAQTTYSVAVDVAAAALGEAAVEQLVPMLALYDAEGKLVGIGTQEASGLNGGVSELTLTATARAQVDGVQVFLLDGGDYAPLCAALAVGG